MSSKVEGTTEVDEPEPTWWEIRLPDYSKYKDYGMYCRAVGRWADRCRAVARKRHALAQAAAGES